MSYYDVNNPKFRNKQNSFYADVARSARSRSNINMPHINEFRRTKSSIAHRDIKLPNNDKEDSFSSQFQKQILSRKSFLPDTKNEKQNSTLLIKRRPDEKSKNPDRISLDRQNLTICPILENEDNLRLLNYQYNFISQIQHLEHLKKLILLDLYDNRIERISGLDNLRSLRVLMLGRNRITKIEGLSNLARLDVLDLHGNSISCVENLSHLSELRVLNIAGNHIKQLDNLKGLVSLIELNARRNLIETVSNITSVYCPNLQRIFLSYNQLMKMSDFECLADLSSLSELSIDNNPVCRHSNIRAAMVATYQTLDQLDLKPISDDERIKSRQIVNRLESTVKPNSQLSKHLNLSSQRSEEKNLQKFHTLKDRRRASINSSSSSSSRPPMAPSPSSLSQTPAVNLLQQQQQLAVTNYTNNSVSECSSNSLYITDPQILALSTSETNVDYYHQARSLRSSKSLPMDQCFITQQHQQHQQYPLEFNSSRDFITIEESSLVNKTKPQSLIKSSSSSTLNRPSSGNLTIKKRDNMIKTNGVLTTDPLSSPSTSTNSTIIIEQHNLPEICSESEEIKFQSIDALKKFDDREYWLNFPNMSTTITTVVFQTIPFSEIEKYLSHIKSRFPNFKKMVLSSNQIHSYIQINSLANLKRMEELIIEPLNNPVLSFVFLRSYIIFRLAHLGLKSFNQVDITASEYTNSRRTYLQLSTISPHYTTQFHLLGLMSDIRRRELLHSIGGSTTNQNQFFSSSYNNAVNIDLVGKSGLLSFSADSVVSAANNAAHVVQEISSEKPVGECNDKQEASCRIIDSIMTNVEQQWSLTESFHSNWMGVMLQLMLKRWEPMKSNRANYMRRQLVECVNKSK